MTVPDTLTRFACAFEGHIARASGWYRAGYAFAAGALSVAAFAPVFLWPVLFLTLPVLVWLIDSSGGTKRAFCDGWWFGFGYFFVSLYWIGEAFLVEAEKFAFLLPFAVTLLPAGLAVFFASASAAARTFWGDDFRRVLLLAAALAVSEWLRGHLFSGFPWNVIGYALTATDTMMQSAALAGVYALTLPAVLIFAGPLVLLASGNAVSRAGLAAALPLAMIWGFGLWRLPAGAAPVVPNVKIRVVQPSIPQREKWMPEFQARNFTEHLSLSGKSEPGLPGSLDGITHIIWPEAAMPFLPLEHPEALEAIGSLLGSGRQLITGALRRAKPGDPGYSAGQGGYQGFNSLMVFKGTVGGGAELSTLYDKVHLVPFGEYLPIEPVLKALGLTRLAHGHGAFLAGPLPRPLLDIPGLPPAGGLICYEILFPGEVTGAPRPGVLLNVTNDGWFGSSIGPPAHFHQARVRAVEEGLPLVRAANNGISAMIDPYGRVMHKLDLNVRGAVDSVLPAAVSHTVFSRYGNSGFLFLIALTLLLPYYLPARNR